MSRNRKTTKSFGHSKNVTLLTPNYGMCLETGKGQNPLKTESVWKQEKDKIPWLRKVSRNRKITKSFCTEAQLTQLTRGPRNRKITKSLDYEKCPETGKLQHPLITESVQKQENYKIPWLRKVSRNRKITKSFGWAKNVTNAASLKTSDMAGGSLSSESV